MIFYGSALWDFHPEMVYFQIGSTAELTKGHPVLAIIIAGQPNGDRKLFTSKLLYMGSSS